jgi:hypothetical protein
LQLKELQPTAIPNPYLFSISFSYQLKELQPTAITEANVVTVLLLGSQIEKFIKYYLQVKIG